MTLDRRHPVVLCWHMHQPEYRVAGVPRLPWVYLHGLRAYADMAAHLEAVPGARAVVNFSPVLLEQLLECALQAQAAWSVGALPAEPLMSALLAPPAPDARAAVLRACLRAHERHGYYRFPEYAALARRAAAALDAGDVAVAALEIGEVLDLVVWYHLISLGEDARRSDPRIAHLMARARGFDAADARLLLGLVAETLAGIVPRYRALAWSGRIELSMSPYYHPLLPLLLDFESAREAAPGTALPPPYPGGRDRAQWQVRAGREGFESIFGIAPSGCWPSEAAVSTPTLELLGAAGFDWAVSGESVLRASLAAQGDSLSGHHRLYASPGQRTTMFFRDDGLSDRIGFVYKDWRAEDAVNDLVHHLEQRAAAHPQGASVLALDGENAWEHYPDNAIEFVRGVYARLAQHPRLRLATFAECLDDPALERAPLPPLIAGSWVHGQLLTWVGHPEKNHAWQMLIDARARFAEIAPVTPAALHALGACEGSDWFWWPGDHHLSEPIREFDALFRAHLTELYRQMGLAAPEILSRPFAHAREGASDALGAMRPSA